MTLLVTNFIIQQLNSQPNSEDKWYLSNCKDNEISIVYKKWLNTDGIITK